MTELEKPIQKEEPDLYKRSIKGGFWVFALQGATQAMGFVKSIIVFNFLFNQNLELLIVAQLLIAVLTTFSESGFHSALIQKKEDIESYLDTAWVIGILRGIGLFAIMFLVAPWFVTLKVEPEQAALATSVIRVMALSFLIGPLRNIGVVYFRKEMQFHKTFWLGLVGTITDIVLSITFVVIYKSIWGYVAARLMAGVVNVTMSYLMSLYRPKFNFVPEKAKELWKFGKWVFGANIIGYLLREGDDWFVWFYLGGEPLKLYRYAYNFANLPATHFASMISGVSFPAYSKIQHDLPRLRSAHLKVLQSTAMLSVPMAFFIVVFASDFVKLFLVPESYEMIPVIQILAIVGLLHSLGSSFWALYQSVGKPYFGLLSQSLRIVLLVSIIYPLTHKFGINGTALSVAIVQSIIYPIGFYIGSKLLKCSLWELTRPLLFLLLPASLIYSIVIIIKTCIVCNITILLFCLLAFIAWVLYFAALWLLDGWFKMAYRNLLTEQLDLFTRKIKSRYYNGPKT